MRTLANVTPTPDQLPILADDKPGFRIIRGAAGSGKTTAALMRIRQLCASRMHRRTRLGLDQPVRILVLTFNRTLRGYIRQLASEQVEESEGLHLDVETFSKWAKSIVGNRRIVGVVEYARLVRPLLSNTGVSAQDIGYFTDEISHIIGRYPAAARETYMDARRTGRGRSPVVDKNTRAKLLTDVIAPYEARKEAIGKIDWNDLAIEAAHAPNQGYDVVVVDEAQDLSANQLRAVLAHLNDDHSTTFIIDAVQRIYPQRFTWNELGIQVRPEMVFALSRNHRNTQAIARFARLLVEGLPREEDGVLPDETTSGRVGELPQVVAGRYDAQLKHMIADVKPCLRRGHTVGILHPRGGGWFAHARRTLDALGISYCELTRTVEWPTGPEQVALSTIHSAKGLEFDHVLMPGLNAEVTSHGKGDGDGTLESLRRLLAMGVGRARVTVSVGYKPGQQSTLVDLLDPSTYRSVEV